MHARISRRYKKIANLKGENWKKIRINDLLFKEAYERELAREEIKATNLRPSRKTTEEYFKKWQTGRSNSKFTKRKSSYDWLANPSSKPSGHSEKCQCPLCSGGYGELNPNEMKGVGSIFEEPKANDEPKSFVELHPEPKVDNVPMDIETIQTIAYLKWKEQKYQEKLRGENENGNED